MRPLLELERVSTGFGRVPVLHRVSLEVGPHERLGLFGPNGHGKTTLLRAISGLLPLWSGAIRFEGQTISGLSPKEIVGLGLIHVPQGNQLFPDMSVLETLRLGAFAPRARGQAGQNLERVLALFPKLAERRAQPVKTLSGGERQMVAIGVGLMGDPRLLMLDEPTLGLAPKIKDELCDAIAEISSGGVPMILVEQDVEFLLSLIQRLVMIDHGEAKMEISAEEGLRHDQIMAMYFGQGTAA